jgi:hypothetical protein
MSIGNSEKRTVSIFRTQISKNRRKPDFSLRKYVPPLPRDLADLKARIIAAVKNIDAPIWTRVRQELEYRIDVCRVTRGAHIEQL